jgi:hypothetical protein
MRLILKFLCMTYGRSWLVDVKTGTTTGEYTVGVFRWVFERTISKKSPAVGTGAIALRPLVDIVMSTVQGKRCMKTKILGLI